MSYWVQREEGEIVSFHVSVPNKDVPKGWELVDDIPDRLKHPPEPESIEDKIRRIVKDEIEKDKIKVKP